MIGAVGAVAQCLDGAVADSPALPGGRGWNWNEQKEICMAMVKAMAGGGSREDCLFQQS